MLPVAGFALLALALLIFASLVWRVHGGGTFGFDTAMLSGLRDPLDPSRPVGPAWLETAAFQLTALGGGAVLTLVVTAVAGLLAAARRFHAAVYLLAATILGAIVEAALKSWLQRPRPAIVPHLVDVISTSFPSAHAANSAIIYLTVALLLGRGMGSRRVRLYLVGVALSLTILIGLSRVYLGVHYPSDVLAGWLLGASWATLAWRGALHLQRKGTIETPPAT